MSVQQMRVIIDDNAGVFVYEPGCWDINDQVMWYQGSTYFGSFNRTAPCTFSVPFLGTSIAFIGNTPAPSSSQTASFSLDQAPPYNSSYDSPPGQQSYVQWYQSPLMADGLHDIAVTGLDGTAVDMAIITVGPNTSLENYNIFVDDDDPSVTYTGHWNLDQSTFHAGNVPSGLPVGNTTHTSNTVGDIMGFTFAGTSISAYGIFQWAKIGNMSLLCTLDGVPSAQTYLATADSPQFSQNDATNFVFFSQNNLSPGVHSLSIQVVEVFNQNFKLDYMVYTPSFSSFAEMPNLTVATPTSGTVSATGSSTPSPSGFSTVFSSTQTTSPVSASSSSTAASSPDQVGGKSAKSAIPAGAIVGSIMAVVLVMGLVVVFLMRVRRRRKVEKWTSNLAPSMNDQSSILDGKA